MVEIHKLQKETATLLNHLYLDDHLPVTPAMLAIQNGHYPDIRKILSTLTHYKDNERVKVFVKENRTLVEETKQYLIIEDSRETEIISTEDYDENIFSKALNDISNSVTLFEKIKSITLKDIELSISNITSKKLDEEVKATISDISDTNDNWESDNVEIKLILSK